MGKVPIKKTPDKSPLPIPQADIFKEENHDLSRSGRPKSRVKRLEEIVNWFERYLGPNHENEI